MNSPLHSYRLRETIFEAPLPVNSKGNAKRPDQLISTHKLQESHVVHDK